MRRVNSSVVGVIGILTAGPWAMGQLVTPPLPAPEPTPAPELPPHYVKPPPTPGVDMPTPEQARDQIKTMGGGKRPEEPLPDLVYQSLVKRDEAGKLARLKEPSEIAALAVNPMLDDEAKKRIVPALAERRAAFERAIIDNLDLVERIDAGFIEQSNLIERGKDGTSVINTIKPLRPPAAPGPIHVDFVKQNVLSRDQGRFNKKISDEYDNAARTEGVTKDGDKAKDAQALLHRYVRSSVDEPMMLYHAMLEEAAPNAGAILGKLSLSSEALQGAKGALGAGAEGVKKALATLTLDQRKEFLRQVVATRAK